MRLVLDTDVVVAALRSPGGASAQLLLAADEGWITLLASVPLFLEYEAVCTRTSHMQAAGLSAGDVAIFLDRLVDLVEPIVPWFLWRPQLRDPGDEVVLETAVNGRADMLVSFNTRHFLPAAERFGMPVLRPGEALGRLRT